MRLSIVMEKLMNSAFIFIDASLGSLTTDKQLFQRASSEDALSQAVLLFYRA